MTNLLESKEFVVSEKVKQKRPDGFEVDRYKNLKSWSYRKWAWEFLRRNVDFIEACKKVTSGTEEEKMAVAQKFGLKKFSNYSGQLAYLMLLGFAWMNFPTLTDSAMPTKTI